MREREGCKRGVRRGGGGKERAKEGGWREGGREREKGGQAGERGREKEKLKSGGGNQKGTMALLQKCIWAWLLPGERTEPWKLLCPASSKGQPGHQS